MARDRQLRTAVGTTLVMLSALAAAPCARAQLSADPYKPYNAEYEQYIYPSYPGDVGVTPNQAVLEGRGGSARSYQRFLEAEDEMDRASSNYSTAPGRRGIGIPYYRAYRDYDKAYNRVYTPNKKADESYLAAVRERDDLYAQYMAETDPKKRAELLKKYQDYRRRATRELDQGRLATTRRPASARSTEPTSRRPPVPGSAEPRPGRSTDSNRATTPRRPSNTDILERSESQERATRRPPGPTAPSSRRPPVDRTP